MADADDCCENFINSKMPEKTQKTMFKLQTLKNNIDQTKKICTMQKQKFYFLFKKNKTAFWLFLKTSF